MHCLDDCHHYVLDDETAMLQEITFFLMTPDGSKYAGTTNEELIKVLLHRLNYLNNVWMDGKFRCRENSIAITKLDEALMWLNKRTEDRIARGVESTHDK